MMAVLAMVLFRGGGGVKESSLIMLAGLLPTLLFSPVAGWLCDRFDRKWLMIISETQLRSIDRRLDLRFKVGMDPGDPCLTSHLTGDYGTCQAIGRPESCGFPGSDQGECLFTTTIGCY